MENFGPGACARADHYSTSAAGCQQENFTKNEPKICENCTICAKTTKKCPFWSIFLVILAFFSAQV